MDEDNIIEIAENGQMKKIKILKYFTWKETGRDYIIYKNFEDNELSFIAYAGEVVESEDVLAILPITDDVALAFLDIFKEYGVVQNGKN